MQVYCMECGEDKDYVGDGNAGSAISLVDREVSLIKLH
jgi:hypothetical protein